jgi:hypothetical protein
MKGKRYFNEIKEEICIHQLFFYKIIMLCYEPNQQEPSKCGTIVVTLIGKSVAYRTVVIN